VTLVGTLSRRLLSPHSSCARVRITMGTSALGPVDNPAGGTDIVAMDDFIYAEPVAVQAVPEPSTLLLFGTGAVALVSRVRRRVWQR